MAEILRRKFLKRIGGVGFVLWVETIFPRESTASSFYTPSHQEIIQNKTELLTRLAGEEKRAPAKLASPFSLSLERISLEKNEEVQTTFEKLLAPFIAEAQKRRVERAAKDPEYAKRVDQELNKNRVNFLLFGQGETYEPPNPIPDKIGSHTIVSYDTKNKIIDLVSITHDTRAPEIERYLKEWGENFVFATKIHLAYDLGNLVGRKDGFALQRLVLENATGLSVDFQTAFADEALVELTKQVFGKIKINNPKSFRVNAFAYKNKLYPPGEFPPGEIELDGLGVIQFIKTIVIEENPRRPDPELEHNARKALVFKEMFAHWQNLNPLEKTLFLGKFLTFLNSTSGKTIASDFDIPSLLIRNIGSVINGLGSLLLTNNQLGLEPAVNKTVYICDERHGTGGVRWISLEEYRRGNYLDRNMEIPVGGDPKAEDLITGYWLPVRLLVERFLKPPPDPPAENLPGES